MSKHLPDWKLPGLDRAIMERVVRRDAAALDLFFECFFDRVYGYTRAVVRDGIVVDDLVQTAFFRLHQSIERLDPERNPSAWVFTVVNNVIRDYWRSRAVRVDHESVGVVTEDSSDLGSDPVEELIRLEDLAQLEKAFGLLSEHDRELLWLREVEELSLIDIAGMLGLSHAVVRQRHVRAVRRLSAAFQRLEEARGKL